MLRIFALLALLLTAAPSEVESAAELSIVTPSGYGLIRMGMSKNEALKQLGSGWKYESVHSSSEGDDGDCGYIDKGGSPYVSFMIEDDVVTRIDISGEGGTGILTTEGIGIGALESDVLAAYGDKVATEPRPYDGLPSKALTVWEEGSPATNLNARGIRFLTDGDRVEEIYAGTAAIEYWEGCS